MSRLIIPLPMTLATAVPTRRPAPTPPHDDVVEADYEVVDDKK
jgi:hypothetical protein